VAGRFGRITIASLGISLAIEVMQYIMAVGAADIDDLILNTLGGILGFLILKICGPALRALAGKHA
jgi:glycopeptide antibiotics resistance protein